MNTSEIVIGFLIIFLISIILRTISKNQYNRVWAYSMRDQKQYGFFNILELRNLVKTKVESNSHTVIVFCKNKNREHVTDLIAKEQNIFPEESE